VAHKLKDAFPILYKGKNGNVAHECIIDIRKIKSETGITEEDIAKRLIDFWISRTNYVLASSRYNDD
jgi:glycine dehydrogenase